MTGPADPLRPYVPEIVARWLDEAPDTLCRQVDGSLLFADLSGFTALSERLARLGREGAEQLTEVIDTVFSDLIAAADADSGQLLSFGGDALLLLFTSDEHERRAARAAHGLRAQVRGFGQLATGVGSVRLRVSIGVHSGSFAAALVGGGHRMLMLVGDEASATVRAEHAADAGDIVLSSATAAALPRPCVRERRGVHVLSRPPDVSSAPRIRTATGGDPARALPPRVRAHIESGVDLLQHRTATIAFLQISEVGAALREDAARTITDLHDIVTRTQEVADRRSVCVLAADIDDDAVKLVLAAGVPSSAGDDEERMLLVVREVMETSSSLSLRAGVHRGPLFAGTVGPAYRRTFTVMGDTVNLAARVMAHAEPGQLLATPEVVDRSRRAFTTLPVPAFVAKGKRAPVTALSVEGLATTQEVEAPSTADVVGRTHELTMLRDAWHTATDLRRPQFVELVGEPGIGKTTILSAFAADIPADQRVRLRGDLYTRTTPYRGLRSLLQLTARLPDDSPDLDAAVLTLGDRLDPQLRPLLPLLNDVLLCTLAATASTTALGDDARRRALAGLCTAVIGIACVTPTLFVLEDAHWFDDATAEWLSSLASSPPDRPWCIVSTRRPVDGGFCLDADAGARVEVHPLGEEAAAELIRSERGDRSAPPHLVRTISARAAGNPLYLRELVRALGPDDDVDILPGSLDALLTARLDQLPPGDRHLVCRASVLGQRFALHLLPVVLDEGSAPVTPGVLARIRDFVTPVPGERLGFGHALIRDAAYELLPYRTRRMLHGRVAEHLTASGSAEPGVLSYHYFAAQQWSEAWQSARSAADAALASHAPVEAAELLDRALESGRRIEGMQASVLLATGLELSRAYERSSRYDAAERAYRRIGRWATDPVDRARVKVQLAWLAERRSNIALAVRRARSAAALLEAPGISPELRDVCLAEARTIEGMGLELSGDHRAAAAALTDAVRLARRRRADRTEAQAASILDWALAMSGQLDEPVNLQRALDLYRSLDDVPGEAACLTNLGALAYLDGRWPEAVDYYRQGQAAHARSGDETSAALGAANTGEVLSDQGHWDDAVVVLTEALDVWRATGHEHGVAYALGLLGRTHARAHHFDEALGGLEEARDRHLAIGAKGDAAQVWLWLAEAHCLRGSADVVDETLAAGAEDGSVTAERIRATTLGLRSPASGVDALIAARAAAAAEHEVFETVVIDHTLAALDTVSARDHVTASQTLAQQLGVQRVSLPVSLT